MSKLRTLKSAYLDQKYDMENCIVKSYPERIRRLEELIPDYTADAQYYMEQVRPYGDAFPPMVINGIRYDERKDAAVALLEAIKKVGTKGIDDIGDYLGFRMGLAFSPIDRKYILSLCRQRKYEVELGSDASGNIVRIINELGRIEKRLEDVKTRLGDANAQLEAAKVEVEKPFAHENELSEKTQRLAELNAELDLDGRGSVLDVGLEPVDEKVKQRDRGIGR